MGLHPSAYADIVKLALSEDIGSGDLTAMGAVSPDARSVGRIVAKQDLTLCGMDVAKHVFRLLDAGCRFLSERADGERFAPGDEALRVEGRAIPMLMAERTALNFMQRLSGVATLSAQYAAAVQGTGATILDTRKTTPGLRALEKYAVRVGGARNHRTGLYDGVLIKENHIRAAGSIERAVASCRRLAHPLARVEVEVTDLEELDQAIAAGADVVMLDNFDPEAARRAVEHVGGRVKLEVSGGMNLDTVRAYAETGVDFISVGRLTHSAPAVDLSMLFEETVS